MTFRLEAVSRRDPSYTLNAQVRGSTVPFDHRNEKKKSTRDAKKAVLEAHRGDDDSACNSFPGRQQILFSGLSLRIGAVSHSNG